MTRAVTASNVPPDRPLRQTTATRGAIGLGGPGRPPPSPRPDEPVILGERAPGLARPLPPRKRGPRGPRERATFKRPAAATAGGCETTQQGACAGSMRMRGACGGRPCCFGCPLVGVECCGCCLGGGRWGRGYMWCPRVMGQRLHKSKGPCCSPSLKFVRTARPFESCANKSSTHQNLLRNVRYESGFGGLRPPVRNAENSNST
jgi:hypothetical protein